jgi:hypothetical protein
VQFLKELVYLPTNPGCDIAEILGDCLHRHGTFPGLRSGFAHSHHLVRGFAGAIGCRLDAARYLLSCGALLSDGSGNGSADIADVANGALDRRNGLDSIAWSLVACR